MTALARRQALSGIVACAALTAAGCSSTSSGPQATPSSPTHPGAASGSPRPVTSLPETSSLTGSPSPPSDGVPRPAHVVLVVFENEGANQVIGSPDAPFINSLASGGADFTRSYAVTHPSQPNYLALFSGSTQGVTNDDCGGSFDNDNLAHELLVAGFTFTSYAEGLPAAGSETCTSGNYARKHAPWTDFANVPASVQQPFTSFPRRYGDLPDVSWVIPDLCNDMHDCSVATGDAWLRQHLGGYAAWAGTHDSLLVVTFDEDDDTSDNRIATVISGQDVRPGSYSERITHYSVLRTLEDMYDVPRLGNAADAAPITDVWR